MPSRALTIIRRMARYLVTGAAGFIGSHLCRNLAQAGHAVVGCDNFDPHTDVSLKRARVAALLQPVGVPCHALDLAESGETLCFVQSGRYDAVVHLAALAGVRASLDAPLAYVRANVHAFTVVLEACRQAHVPQVLYASSSSVYGARQSAPFHESDRIDRPESPYAATKAANELLAHSLSHAHGLALTGLRFFTVYGPWGRPDMAYTTFAERMRRGQPITLYNGGEVQRDFTFVDDTVHAIVQLLRRGPTPREPGRGVHEIFNVGHRQPTRVIDFVRALEQALDLRADIRFAPLPTGDVPLTCADDSRLVSAIGPWPHTALPVGLQQFADWYLQWTGATALPA